LLPIGERLSFLKPSETLERQPVLNHSSKGAATELEIPLSSKREIVRKAAPNKVLFSNRGLRYSVKPSVFGRDRR
jgi:hypothetical protein